MDACNNNLRHLYYDRSNTLYRDVIEFPRWIFYASAFLMILSLENDRSPVQLETINVE